MDQVICKELIVTTLTRKGDGTISNPVRVITEVYEKDGKKVAEYDPNPCTYSLTDLIDFARWLKKNDCDPTSIGKRHVEDWLNEMW